MSIIVNIDESVRKYLDGDIKNPIYKKVIEEEIKYVNNLHDIFKTYIYDIIESANFNDKLTNLSNLIKNLSKNDRDILRTLLLNIFIELSQDQQMFLIITMTPDIKNIFELFIEDNAVLQILKYIISGLMMGLLSGVSNEEYIIKCIDVCTMIKKSIADEVVCSYFNDNNDILLRANDKLISFFIKYGNENKLTLNIRHIIENKIMNIKNKLDTLSLTTMDYAFEIYKLGSFLIDCKISYAKISYENIIFNILNVKEECIEYIVKSIHTCILNNNIEQAQKILSVIYCLTETNLNIFVKYYNKSLKLRMKMPNILQTEYTLWNINDDYKLIMADSIFLPYIQTINNIKYSRVINDELTKIKIKNSNIDMNKVDVTLTNPFNNNVFENIVHHKTIQQYINGLDIYIKNKSSLQNMLHEMEESTIKFKTPMGSITCSLIFGSILLHLCDGELSIKELSELLKINEDEVNKRITILIKYNIVIYKDNKYKYVQPYGNVVCKLIDIDDFIVIQRFTDIELTTDSRIIKEVKPNSMNKMELERRVQEYMRESFVRSIFYDRIDSLIKRFYIKETNSIIEYVC